MSDKRGAPLPGVNGSLHGRMVPDFEIVAEAIVNRYTAKASVADRLEKRFGLGEDPQKRRALYRQIQRLHDRWPLEMDSLICEAIKIAVEGEDEARLFCAVVKRFIASSGLTGARRKGRSLEW